MLRIPRQQRRSFRHFKIAEIKSRRDRAANERVTGLNRRAKLEASGGVRLATVRAIAETGVDYISVGALTHSARAVDFSLEMQTDSRE